MTHYKETRNAYCNCEKRIYSGTGIFNFPAMIPQEFDLEDFEILGFNYAKGEDYPEDKIVHFYLDDYQFERVWKDPKMYAEILKPFRAVLSPDFSLYDDFPLAVNIYNHYRKQWISRYWQDLGLKMIPTLCWLDEASFDWCFDGVPKHSTVSISVIGCNKGDGRDYWTGFNKAIEVLQPERIILFKGNSPVELPNCGGAEIVEVRSGNLKGAKDFKDGVSKYNEQKR